MLLHILLCTFQGSILHKCKMVNTKTASVVSSLQSWTPKITAKVLEVLENQKLLCVCDEAICAGVALLLFLFHPEAVSQG